VNDDVVLPSYHSTVSGSGLGRFHPDAAARDTIPKARPKSSAHRGAASVARTLGRDLARGLRIGHGVALVAQTQLRE
jgi:hypothetical protein